MYQKILSSFLALLGFFLSIPLFFIIALYFNWFGLPLNSGEITNLKIPSSEILNDGLERKQIFFGDLHVHSSYSLDAYLLNFPLLQGEGIHPIGDACDYARFCSNIDFWSINDHAAWLTPREWKKTIGAIQQCNAISSDENLEKESDVVAFLGWEWTQRSTDPKKHFGHKNIILKSIDLQEIPLRPIAANLAENSAISSSRFILQASLLLEDFQNRDLIFDLRYKQLELEARRNCNKEKNVKQLPSDCLEIALNPGDLFRKLEEWDSDILVIPHGTAWGNTAPPLASWEHQLSTEQNNNNLQRLIEVYSGHGNSEEYRSWRSLVVEEDYSLSCPSPVSGYLPSCFQAGEIIKKRCLFSAGSEEECELRRIEAIKNYVSSNPLGHLSIPSQLPEEWLDSGQCKDCFLPAFNYRPGLSVQNALALTDFSGDVPFRFRFGFIGSSDNHQAKAGSGYKEISRLGNTDSRGFESKETKIFVESKSSVLESNTSFLTPKSVKVDANSILASGSYPREVDRGSSFFISGGLVAVHSERKNRDFIWEALHKREVYATSGDRILLWFDQISPKGQISPMGSELKTKFNPSFRVKAIGAFKQNSGCQENELINPGVSERIQELCKGECYNPSDERKLISRIEIVRIRPQIYKDEPLESLIQDPWKIIPCEDLGEGCSVEFQDLQFEDGTREVIYYARAIQEPSQAINAQGLNCQKDQEGNCIKVDICYGDYRGLKKGDCLGEVEERAWSSPIFVSYDSLNYQP
ncbi:MAG: DUF3604 domain-containing protein [SAR86 cluster bacterium]|nr:DUF3604 domain-containing protein [SAR86 cluster bacterium]